MGLKTIKKKRRFKTMSRLADILITGAEKSDKEKKVVFSSRYKNADGSPVEATITQMTSRQNNNYRKQATKHTKKGKESDFDHGEYMNFILLNHVKDPDFSKQEDITKAGVNTPEDYIDKVLNAGEVDNLVMEIMDFSGINESLDDIKKEVKKP